MSSEHGHDESDNEKKEQFGLGASYSYADISPPSRVNSYPVDISPRRKDSARPTQSFSLERIPEEEELEAVADNLDVSLPDPQKRGSVTIQSKRINDQLLQMEFELLDALEQPEEGDNRELTEEGTPQTIIVQVDETSEISDLKAAEILRERRKWFCASLIFGLFVLFITAIIIVLVFVNCIPGLGCRQKHAYSEIFVSFFPENGSISITPSQFARFTQVQEMLNFLEGTKANVSSVEASGVLINTTISGFTLFNASVLLPGADVHDGTSELRPGLQPRFQGLSFTNDERERSLVGPLVCGRLSPATPILNLYPVLYTSYYLVDKEPVEITNYMDTAMTPEDLLKLNSTSTNSTYNGVPFHNMPQCCVEFVSTEARFIELLGRVNDENIAMRIMCQAGFFSGGKFEGWSTIFGNETKEEEWIQSIKTGGESLSATGKVKESAVIVSGVADEYWQKGLLVSTGVTFPVTAFNGIKKMYSSPLINGSIAAFVPFEEDLVFNYEGMKNKISLVEELGQFDFESKFVPPVFHISEAVGVVPEIISTGLNSFGMKISDGSPLVTFSGGCPVGYQIQQDEGCLKNGYGLTLTAQKKISSTSNLFLLPETGQSKNAVIVDFDLNANGASLDQSIVLKLSFRLNGPLLKGLVLTEDINENFRFFFLTDNGERPADNALFEVEPSFNEYGKESLGGQWDMVSFNLQLPIDSGVWNSSEAVIDVPFSRRSGRVSLAIQPSLSSWEVLKSLEIQARLVDFKTSAIVVTFEDIGENPFKVDDTAYVLNARVSRLRLFGVAYNLLLESIVKTQSLLNNSVAPSYNIFGKNVFQEFSKNRNHSPIIDSVIFSGRKSSGFPFAKDFVGSSPLSLFSYPPSVGDTLPPAYTKVWYEPQDALLNNTFLLAAQQSMQDVFQIVTGVLDSVRPLGSKTVIDTIIETAEKYESGIYYGSDYDLKDIKAEFSKFSSLLFENQDLIQTFPQALNATTDWFKRWGIEYGKISKDDFPMMYQDLLAYSKRTVAVSDEVDTSTSLYSDIDSANTKDWTPLSMIAASVVDLFMTRTDLVLWHKVSAQNFSEPVAELKLESLASSIFTGSYLRDFYSHLFSTSEARVQDFSVKQSEYLMITEGEDFDFAARKDKMFAPDSPLYGSTEPLYCDTFYRFCGSLNATRAFLSVMLLEACYELSEIVEEHNSIPDLFPYEAMLPYGFGRTRTDVPFMSESMSKWMGAKALRRSAWLTKASFNYVKRTSANSLDKQNMSLLSQFLLPTIELMNLQLFMLEDSTMISSDQYAALMVLDAVNNGDDEQLKNALLRVSLLN